METAAWDASRWGQGGGNGNPGVEPTGGADRGQLTLFLPFQSLTHSSSACPDMGRPMK